jgi:hypothetical protein
LPIVGFHNNQHFTKEGAACQQKEDKTSIFFFFAAFSLDKSVPFL